jgi:hypothetical protein
VERLLDRPVGKPVEFARWLDLTATASQSWLSLVGVLAREAGTDDGLLTHLLDVANLQHLLIQGLLLTQPHNYADALRDGGRPASEAVVKEPIELMRCYPRSVWTTAGLAHAMGVSARGAAEGVRQVGRAAAYDIPASLTAAAGGRRAS